MKAHTWLSVATAILLLFTLVFSGFSALAGSEPVSDPHSQHEFTTLDGFTVTTQTQRNDPQAEPASSVTVTGTRDYTAAFDVLALVNAERAKENLPPLTMNTTLLDAAMTRATECSVYYSHTRPDGTAAHTVIDGHHTFRENIAIGQDTASMVMNSWLNSSVHYANIMSTDCTEVGIGAFSQGDSYTWAQIFTDSIGTPQASPVGNQTVTVSVSALNTNLALSTSSNSIEMTVGATEQLSVFVSPDQVFFKTKLDHSCIRYHSNNTDVVTVSDRGLVTAVGNGSATVSALLKNSVLSIHLTALVGDGEVSTTQPSVFPTESTQTATGTKPTATTTVTTTTVTTTATATTTAVSTTETASTTATTSKTATTVSSATASTGTTVDAQDSTANSAESTDSTTQTATTENDTLIVFAQTAEIKLEAAPNTFDAYTEYTIMPALDVTVTADHILKHKAYLISAFKGFSTVKPNGTVQLTFAIPNGFAAKNTSLVFIRENGFIEPVTAAVNEAAGYITATVAQFGTYAVVETKPTGTTASPSTPSDSAQNTPVLWIVLVAILLASGVAAWYFLYYQKQVVLQESETDKE